MSADATTAAEPKGDMRLAVLLAMAMFVLVVDTSLMNVSISAVVHDLDTTASGVQSAIALEALVSAAFILIGSKIGDLIGRKRAYVLGLLGYAAGALSMTLSQTLLPIVIFWAIVGGLGAALLLPSMQSLIHGNFEGPMQRRAYALVGAAAAIAAASRAAARRIHHDVPLLAGRVRRRGRRDRDRARRQPARPGRPVHGPEGRRRRRRDPLGARDGRRRARDPRLGGRRRSGRRPHRRRGGRARVARLVAAPAQARGQAGAARRRPVRVEVLPARDLVPDAPADRPRRADDRAADLPADGARVQRDGGRPLARSAVVDDVRRRAARRTGRRAGAARARSSSSGSCCSRRASPC